MIFFVFRVAPLICGHVFHLDCIKRWFEDGPSRRKTCAYCNQVNNQELKKLILSPEIPLTAAKIELEKINKQIIEYKENEGPTFTILELKATIEDLYKLFTKLKQQTE